jgi:formylglycine-generating enzyme required for sulfatase activity
LPNKFFEESFLGKGSLGVAEAKPQVQFVKNTDVRERALGEPMVLVSAGKFLMGRNDGFPDQHPAHEVTVHAFWIDKYEVTNGHYGQFVPEGANAKYRPDPSYSKSMPRDYFGSVRFTNFPVVNISWNAAKAYCAWRGKRLPTEAEWEMAARGKDSRSYPWGNFWDDQAANYRDLPLASVAGKSPHFTTEVGRFTAGIGPYGTFDMAGNVWEWLADWYRPYAGSRLNSEHSREQYKVIRGGSWVSGPMSLSSTTRDYSDPRFGYDSIGFRCARDQ